MLQYNTFTDNVVSFSVKLNGVLKAVSGIYLFPMKGCRVILENLLQRTAKNLKNYLIPFSKQNSLNRSGVSFHNFAFLELNDVAKYGCIRLQ